MIQRHSSRRSRRDHAVLMGDGTRDFGAVAGWGKWGDGSGCLKGEAFNFLTQ
jgi:hypothetical protein